MPEWWHTLGSYRIGDLLMFSPLAHARLFELVNREAWPGVLAAAALPALLATALLWRRGRGEAVALALLALATATMAELHLRQSLAGLTAFALPWAAAFGVLALAALGLAVVCWCGAARARPADGAAGHAAGHATSDAATRALTALLLGLALAWPLAAPALGRPWWQAEVLALAPDPTVLGWLAWAACTQRRGIVWLAFAAVPLAWCAFAGLLGAAMASPLAPVLPVAGAAVVAWRLMQVLARKRTRPAAGGGG